MILLKNARSDTNICSQKYIKQCLWRMHSAGTPDKVLVQYNLEKLSSQMGFFQHDAPKHNTAYAGLASANNFRAYLLLLNSFLNIRMCRLAFLFFLDIPGLYTDSDFHKHSKKRINIFHINIILRIIVKCNSI